MCFVGSPVKAENLDVASKQHTDLSDPRPAKYRKMEGYNSFVMNQTVNYLYQSENDLAIRFIWPKADLQEAMKDHDYLKLPFAEYWVDSVNAVSTRITLLVDHLFNFTSRPLN